jgi:flagellar motor switch protein FliM
VDLAEGAKNGVLTVILPVVPEPTTDSIEKGTKALGRGTTDLGEVVRNAPVTLNAVLARLEMPLKRACKLKVGMRFPISPSALKDTQLTATGGHVVAHVVLGQVNGFRAARLVAGRHGSLPNEPDAADNRSDKLGQSPDIDTVAAKDDGLASPTLAHHMLREPPDQSVDTEAELTQSR